MPTRADYEILKSQVAETQTKKDEINLKLEQERILQAREKNSFDEASDYLKVQLSGFELEQLKNPAKDNVSILNKFTRDLESSLSDLQGEMGEEYLKSFNTIKEVSFNKLRINALKLEKQKEKERALGLTSAVKAKLDEAVRVGNIEEVNSLSSIYESRLNELTLSGFMKKEDAIEAYSQIKKQSLNSLSNDALSDSFEDEVNYSPESAFERLRAKKGLYDNADPSVRKQINKRLLGLKNKISGKNAKANEELKTNYEKVYKNLKEHPSPETLESFQAHTQAYIGNLQKTKTSKNARSVEIKTIRAGIRLRVAETFMNNPSILSNNFSQREVLDAVFKGDKVPKPGSTEFLESINQIISWKGDTRFNTNTAEGQRNLLALEELAKGNTDLGNLNSQAEDKNPSLDVNDILPKGNTENDAVVSQAIQKLEGVVAKSVKSRNLTDPSKTEFAKLTSGEEDSLMQTLKGFAEAGRTEDIGNVLEYLSRNKVGLSNGFNSILKGGEDIVRSVFSNAHALNSSGDSNQRKLSGYFNKGLGLLSQQSNNPDLIDNKKLFSSIVSGIKQNEDLLIGIKRASTNIDGGVKFLALSLLGIAESDQSIKGVFASEGSSTNALGIILGKSEEVRDMINSYKTSTIKEQDNLFVKNGGLYDDNFLQKLGIPYDNKRTFRGHEVESLGRTASVIANSVFPQSGVDKRGNRIEADPFLRASLLTIIKKARPGQDITERTLSEGNFLFREELNGELQLYEKSDLEGVSSPVYVDVPKEGGGTARRPVTFSYKSIKAYGEFLKGKEEKSDFAKENSADYYNTFLLGGAVKDVYEPENLGSSVLFDFLSPAEKKRLFTESEFKDVMKETVQGRNLLNKPVRPQLLAEMNKIKEIQDEEARPTKGEGIQEYVKEFGEGIQEYVKQFGQDLGVKEFIKEFGENVKVKKDEAKAKISAKLGDLLREQEIRKRRESQEEKEVTASIGEGVQEFIKEFGQGAKEFIKEFGGLLEDKQFRKPLTFGPGALKRGAHRNFVDHHNRIYYDNYQKELKAKKARDEANAKIKRKVKKFLTERYNEQLKEDK